MLHFWGGRSAIDAAVYPDMAAFWDDAVRIWTAEIAALHQLGCRYVQIDDVTFPLICDPHGQEALRARGDDPHEILETYAGVLNRIVAGRAEGHGARHAHVPRQQPRQVDGQRRLRVRQRGRVPQRRHAELLHGVRQRPRRRFLAAAARAEGQARDSRPHLDQDPVLESKDVLKRRIDEASKHLPLDQLCLSPQCGFASNFMGNPVTVDDEKRKLALVVETAQEVWGQS